VTTRAGASEMGGHSPMKPKLTEYCGGVVCGFASILHLGILVIPLIVKESETSQAAAKSAALRMVSLH
jgi:hypothetical protein